MHRPTKRLALSVLGLVLFATGTAAPAIARELVAELDPEASEVTFTLDATGHQIHGSFTLLEGALRFDPATRSASGQVVVDATAGETGNDRRDATMHADVLESESHPRIVFHAERVTGDLPAEGAAWEGVRVEIQGSMELNGDAHPFIVPAEVARDGNRFTARAHFMVPYVEWGLEDPSFLFLRVAKEVQVTVEAAGTIRPARFGS